MRMIAWTFGTALVVLGLGTSLAAQPFGKTNWTFRTGGAVQSSPAIGADGTVYVGSLDRKLYALDGLTGDLKWIASTGRPIRSSPVVDEDGNIYVGSDDNRLYAFDPDGNTNWIFGAMNDITSSPAVDTDGVVYVASRDDRLYALDPDGTQRWVFKIAKDFYGSPAIAADGTIYIAGSDGVLYGLTDQGTSRSRFVTGNRLTTSPAIGTNNTVVLSAADNNLYSLRPGSGTNGFVWRFARSKDFHSSPAIGADGTIYVGNDDRRIYAVSAGGTVKWKFVTKGKVRTSPAIGPDGVIYVGSDDRRLYAINPDGTTNQIFLTGGPLRSSAAIAADGTVYVGSNDRRVYAFRGTPGLVTNSEPAWAMFRKDPQHTARSTNGQPIILVAPTNQMVAPGGSAQFSVTAISTGRINYQWLFNGSLLAGATNAVLNISNVQPTNGGIYTVRISNALGSITSAGATLSVLGAPVITQQPTNRTAAAGSSVSFVVVASGTPPLFYQWRLNSTNLAPQTNATLVLSNVMPTQSGNYQVTVTNNLGAVTSQIAVLTVTATTNGVPLILTQPASQTAFPGSNVTFTVAASGAGPLQFQWRLGGTNMSGATNTTLVLSSVTTNQVGYYDVVVRNSSGSVTSTVALLTLELTGAPIIFVQPVNRVAAPGSTVSFTVLAGGSLPITYQWHFNLSAVENATNATLTLTNISAADQGNYLVGVSNAFGYLVSRAAGLTVSSGPPLPGSNLTPGGSTETLASETPGPALSLSAQPVVLRFATEPGKRYVVEVKDRLQRNWVPIKTVPGTGQTETFTDLDSAAAARFYRVRVE